MYKVYWSLANGDISAKEIENLVEALNKTNDLRRDGFRFVSMVSEDLNQVGQLGVSSVENGKLPNGDDYTWKKRRQ